jgi:hypothetical protein
VSGFLARQWGSGGALVATLGQDKRRTPIKTAVAVGVAAITAVDLSDAATITYASVNGGSTVVYVVGQFEYGDENKFAQVTAPSSRVFMSFHSHGGTIHCTDLCRRWCGVRDRVCGCVARR